MRKRRLLYVTGVVTIALLLAGFSCSQNSYAKAGKLAHDFAATVLAAQQVEIAAYQAGKIDAQTHQLIQTELVQVADAGVRLDAAINQAHSASGAAAEVKVIVTLLADLSQNKLSGIKNPDTKLAVQSALLLAQTTIDSIAAFGGAK